MAKKPREPDGKSSSSNGASNSGLGSGLSDIFKTLFGDIQEQQGSVSIFSDDNPFRRRSADPSQTTHQQQQHQQKQQVGFVFGSAEDAENAASGDNENPSFLEGKKRKRNKEKKAILDSGLIDETSDSPLWTKRPKKGEFGAESARGGEGINGDPKEALQKGKGEERKLSLKSEALPEGKEVNAQNKGVELNEKVMEKKKKKKRKRDELEAEYEGRRYGVVRTNDEGGEAGLGAKVVGGKRKSVDDPADMMVSREGFDDEAKLLRTVFVGNLPLKVKKKALIKEFSQFGEVESVRIRSVPLLDSKKPRKGAIIQQKINGAVDSVHAYVVFKAEEAVLASLAHNMAVVGGNHIRVDRACPPHKKLKGNDGPLYDKKRTVFVGNLPFDVKDEELYQLFSSIKDLESSIEAIRVIRDPSTSMGKGIAYILFKTRGAANLVVKKRSLKLRDRELRLCHARSDLTPSKRKVQSPRDNNASPTKKFAVDSRTLDSSKVKTKAASSYQGLRANKSDVKRKAHPKVVKPMEPQSGVQKGDRPKERNKKRPAVAARKANARKGGSGSKQAGNKRKPEIRTPESARPSKKTKKFR